MRARGFGLVELVLIVAVIGALVGAYTLIDSHGYARGRAEEKAGALSLQLVKDRYATKAIAEAKMGRVAAEVAAQGYEAKWKEARRAAQRSGVALGSCDEVPAPAPAGSVVVVGEGVGGDAGAGLRASGDGDTRVRAPRLHWRFVGLHDLRFLSLDGKPLFQDSAGYALDPARADTASPYTLDDAIDVAGDNAGALNACRSAFFAARQDLEVAAQAWNGSGR